MDIAKIRKKAQAKNAEKKPEEKTPVSGPVEDEKKEIERGPVAAEESGVAQEELPAEETAGKEEARAGVFGDEAVPEEKAEDLVELLTFGLSREEYAFRVSEVEEILRFQHITRVPTMPDFVLGITSLRGKIIPVIDLQTRLNLQEKSVSMDSPGAGPEREIKQKEEKKILIIEGPKGLIGATIDKVLGVVRLPLREMLQPPGHLNENELKFIEGIVVLEKRFISMINADIAMDIEAS